MITVISALAGLILGVRAEQRAARAEKQAAELSQKAFAEQVDFYRTPSAVVVMNGNPHPTEMRLVLPGRRLWWELYSLEPCKQIKVSADALRASLRAQLPSAQVSDEELSSLWLEFQNPDGRSWARTGGGALAPITWKPVSRVHMVDLRESWNQDPESSPICGAP
ncbi:hypothetical protein [Streptomyces sp. 900105245]